MDYKELLKKNKIDISNMASMPIGISETALQLQKAFEKEDIINVPCGIVYESYLNWCNENSEKIANNTVVGKAINKLFNLTSKQIRLNKKVTRIYIDFN